MRNMIYIRSIRLPKFLLPAFAGFIAFMIAGTVFAKTVDENTAKLVGQNFLNARMKAQSLISPGALQLVYKAESKATLPPGSGQPMIYFYVFNLNSTGFVIVSGDDNASPVLGYSDEGAFDPGNIPHNVAKWLDAYKNTIRSIIENNLTATGEITAAWQSLLIGQAGAAFQKSTASVNPLIQVKWNQSPYYNDECPGGSVTGCVATAMAQVMKFWNYPATGAGFHSYNDKTYGTLSANFGGTTYQWSSMSDAISGPNAAIATLMFHCGVSVDMEYSPQESSAYVISSQSPVTNCAEYALKTYFGYKTSLKGVERASYNDNDWITLLKTELDAGRPIIYAGFGNGGGHCFVADGYDNNNYIHFNWGWAGAYNGYFYINALNPSGTGTGGGTGGYNSGQQAIIGIEPPSGTQPSSLTLYDYVTPSAYSIYYGQAFNISTNFINNGSATFNGDYCAAVFDDATNFVDYVEIKTGMSLQGGYVYNNDLIFSTTGMLGMVPGIYYIGIFYRPTGGNWAQVANSGNYVNLIKMTVAWPNTIELNSAITVAQGLTLTQGQSASINLNIINEGSTTFYGQYGVGLFTLDGTLAQTIALVNENNGLLPGYTYLSPFLTFSTPAVTVAPGTYLLAVQHKASTGNWQLTGSTYFQNPIKVTVQAAALSPDQYEPNNTPATAYSLAVAFTGNTAHVTTTGSNCHTGSDYDYYKVNLPSGYNYTITSKLHDKYSSGDGSTYSLDGLFSYSTDGVAWSDTYDDTMTGTVTVKGGGSAYFFVAPYFAGETGTYLLDLNITRNPASAAEEVPSETGINVFPNPATDLVTIDLHQYAGRVRSVQLLNVLGEKIRDIRFTENEQSISVPLDGLGEQTYFLRIETNDGIITKTLAMGK